MKKVEVQLLGKPGCHLCDDARAVVREVIAPLPVEFSEVSILDDQQLAQRFVEEIPVVLINGQVHNYWRIDPVRLRTALAEALGGLPLPDSGASLVLDSSGTHD